MSISLIPGKKTKKAKKKKKKDGGRQTNLSELRPSRKALKSPGLVPKLNAIIDRQDRMRVQDPPKEKKSRNVNKQGAKATTKPAKKRKTKKNDGLSASTASLMDELLSFGDTLKKK